MTYTVRVRSTTDGGAFTEKAFAVVVTDVAGIALAGDVVPENQPAGTAVGTLLTLGLPGDSYTYSLVSGTHDTDNGLFTIDGDTLRTAATFDYEAKTSYIIRVRSTSDGGLVSETGLMINVGDVNESPTDVALVATRRSPRPRRQARWSGS